MSDTPTDHNAEPMVIPIIKYGLLWPKDLPDYQIELACYRELRLDPKFQTGHTLSYHFERAIQLLWPEKMPDGRKCYIPSKWSYKRIQSWCENDFQTWWGPASAGKTRDAAIILFTHYLSAPDITAISVCSTDKKMLMRRIFGEIVFLYFLYGPKILPMEYLRGEPSFKFRIPGQQRSSSSNSGIFGVPIIAGQVDKAVGRIIGAHNTFSVLICDELQASYSAVVDQGWDNLSAGCVEAKFLGMGNPTDKMDPLCKASKPKHGGWDSISPELEQWETERGVCLYFDGLKSPGVEDPDRFPFLLTKKQIDDMRKDPGENSPRFWSQRRGFLPPDGLIQTVFSSALIAQHNLQRRNVEWAGVPTTLGAMDEAFSAQGDRCVLVTARVGMTIEGIMMLKFEPEIIINLELNDKEAVEYYICRKVREHCEAVGVSAQRFGLDVSGAQAAMASMFEREWGQGVFRCQFGGSASDMEISRDDKAQTVVTAKDIYANRVTELWYNFRRFAVNGQISGLTDTMCVEASQRILLQKGGKIAVESKKEMRQRTGESPDIIDGCTIIVAMAMERFGMRPGTNNFGDAERPMPNNELAIYNGIEAENNMYSGDQVEISSDENWLDDGTVL